jgi:hypothetical protein
MTVPGKGGAPLKFKTVEILEEKIDSYFEHCEETKRPYTIGGLACALDCHRDTITNYGKREKYFGTVARAKRKIEAYAEEQLFFAKNVNGIIFNLINNFDWRDRREVKQEVNLDGGLDIALIESRKRVREALSLNNPEKTCSKTPED